MITLTILLSAGDFSARQRLGLENPFASEGWLLVYLFLVTSATGDPSFFARDLIVLHIGRAGSVGGQPVYLQVAG